MTSHLALHHPLIASRTPNHLPSTYTYSKDTSWPLEATPPHLERHPYSSPHPSPSRGKAPATRRRLPSPLRRRSRRLPSAMPTTLNAPGQPPTATRVEEVARRSLEIEDGPEVSDGHICLGWHRHSPVNRFDQLTSQPTPAFYLPALSSFLTTNPGDDHFLLELADGGGRGGNGFGAITCAYQWLALGRVDRN